MIPLILFKFFLIVMPLIHSASADALTKCFLPREAFNEEFFDSIYKPLQMTKMKDMKSYCRMTMGQRFLETQTGIGADASQNIVQSRNFEEDLNRIAERTMQDRDAWQNSLIPTRAMREKPLLGLTLPNDFRTDKKQEDFSPGWLLRMPNPSESKSDSVNSKEKKSFSSQMSEVKDLMNTSAEDVQNRYPQWWDYQTKGRKDIATAEEDDRSSKEKGFTSGIFFEAAKAKSCADITLKHFVSCKRSFDRIVEEVKPSKGGSGLPLIKEILTDSKYDEPIRRATLKIMDRINTKAEPGGKSNLMNDLVDSFKESGWSEGEATNGAWKVLGLYGNAGANLGSYLSSYKISKDNMHSKVGLHTIASLLPLLDMKYNDETGQIYSLPSGVSSSCDGKPNYHFWMAAYHARKQSLETQSPVGAASAIYAAAKGYQISGLLGTGRNQGNIFTHSTFSPVQDVVRMDLSSEIAGAAYGAASGVNKKLSINVDDVMKKMNSNARYHKALTPEQVKEKFSGSGYGAYSYWHTIFEPDPVAISIFNQLE